MGEIGDDLRTHPQGAANSLSSFGLLDYVASLSVILSVIRIMIVLPILLLGRELPCTEL